MMKLLFIIKNLEIICKDKGSDFFLKRKKLRNSLG